MGHSLPQKADASAHHEDPGTCQNGPQEGVVTPTSATKIRAVCQCTNSLCICHRDGAHVHCPSHVEENPSFSVTEDAEGGPLLECLSGCPQEVIVEALKSLGVWSASAMGSAILSGADELQQPQSLKVDGVLDGGTTGIVNSGTWTTPRELLASRGLFPDLAGGEQGQAIALTDSEPSQDDVDGLEPALAPTARSVDHRELTQEAAHKYLQAGYSLVPLKPHTKTPHRELLPRMDRVGRRGQTLRVPTWEPLKTQRASEEDVMLWVEVGADFAVVCGAISGGLGAIDIEHPRFYEALKESAPTLLEGLPVQRSGGGGVHLFFRHADLGRGEQLAYEPKPRASGEPDGRKIAIEFRGEGDLITLAPARHHSGGTYQVLEGRIEDAPIISADHLRALLQACRALNEVPTTSQLPEAEDTEQRRVRQNAHPAPLVLDEGAGKPSIIERFNAENYIQDVLEEYGYQARGNRFARPGGQNPTVHIKDNQSFHHSSNDELHNGYWQNPFSVVCHYKYGGNAHEAVKAIAREQERQRLPRDFEHPFGLQPVPQGGEDLDDQECAGEERPKPQLGFPTTDTGNAERFAQQHGAYVRFCSELGGWLCWDGRRWRLDKLGQVKRMAKRTVRWIGWEAAQTRGDEERKFLLSWARRSEAKARRVDMLELAQSEKGIAVPSQAFDTDKWAFNVQNGTLDLRTGQLRPHRRTDHITKLVPIVYDPQAQCPLFLAFLKALMCGSEDLVEMWQRIVGYSLTGDTREQSLFVLHGLGANGKSTLLTILSALLGDYAMQTKPETLLLKRGEGVNNDIARLRGARFVTAVETKEGHSLDESKVKELTGGDVQVARFLFKEFFEYRPEYKIFLATNHKPSIQGTDDGIWRRLWLIPFDARFWNPDRGEEGLPELRADKGLLDKLRAELPGILTWAVQGCLAWQSGGLLMPREVQAATEDYREEEDTLSQFLAECCVLSPQCRTTSRALRDEYVKWCGDVGEVPLNATKFGRRLREKGLRREDTRNARGWKGIGLLTHSDPGTSKDATEGKKSKAVKACESYDSDAFHEAPSDHEWNPPEADLRQVRQVATGKSSRSTPKEDLGSKGRGKLSQPVAPVAEPWDEYAEDAVDLEDATGNEEWEAIEA